MSRYRFIFMWTCILIICSLSLPGQTRSNFHVEGKMEDRGKRSIDDSACSALRQQCLCRQRKNKEQNMVCLKKDCLEKLPTNEIPDSHVRDVVSLLVTRQRNLTRIGSEELRRLGNIRHIRIFRCSISYVAPNAFVGLNYVERLDLHRNNLTEVPSAIRYLRNLKSLNLGGNQISYISRGAFYSNSVLERLVLSRNVLTNMPEMLPSTLIKLSISKNMIGTPIDLRTLNNLEILMADSNKMTAFPMLPSSVKVVSMCFNNIQQPVTLRNLPNLRAVSMNHNPHIGNIQISTFFDTRSRSRTSKLVTLKMRNAGVRSIDADAFACLQQLKHVDISHNDISTYQPDWFTGNKGLRAVNVAGNPWRCECDVKSHLISMVQKFRNRRSRRTRRQGKSLSRDELFVNDFQNETCLTEGIFSCGEFRLKNPTCLAREWVPDDIVEPTNFSPSTKEQTPPAITSSTNKPTTTTRMTTTSSTTTATTTRPTTSISTITTEPKTTTTTTARTTSEMGTPFRTVTTSTILTETTTKAVAWCLKDGRKCHFPFVYNGEEYTECVPAFRPWCSPSYNYDEDGDWDRCVKCD